jgi:hypothetical protein
MAVIVTLYVSDGIGDYMFEFSEAVHQFPYGQCVEFDQPAMADADSSSDRPSGSDSEEFGFSEQVSLYSIDIQ